jgi:hypothetical protein
MGSNLEDESTVKSTSYRGEIPQPSPRQILRLRLPSPKLGRGVGGEGKPTWKAI